ncbi:MAG: hypothetical protein HY735_10355 [Verrucomicrobia bacterium]|nr:hypothetical protein [Verrucomicrobiota bacterium]
MTSVFCGSIMSYGAEKIQISEGTDKAELPSKAPIDDLFSKPLDFQRFRSGDGGGSLIPSLPAPIQPTNLRKDQLEKKKWLQNETENLDQDAALKQIFGIKEYDFEGLGAPSKGGLGDLWGGSSPTKRPNHFGRDLDAPSPWNKSGRNSRDLTGPPAMGLTNRDRSNRPDSTMEEENSDGNGTIAELNLNNLFRPTQTLQPSERIPAGMIRMPSGPNGISQFLNQTFAGSSAGDREKELRAQEFEKLLKGPRLLPSRNNDPINSLPDGTRQELNPIRGTRLDEDSASAVKAFGAGNLPGLGAPLRPGLFDSFNAKVLGSSSLAPSIAAPPPSPIMNAKPPVLEIPRRKF